ncbi:DUF3810 domain-containing protein [Cyclobacterium plantarum]|uniref:DUF3810 domain-containing protein n=1 Tax=Cyclobacterium plantarum TaxID=2716263 RepID=A0ABX0HFJ5_9BACT|nr:DUF3810 domain-containing protein [Cyclobacterium plantarum]NHE59104.1 DUF3810 domain-containing protein [Cyclobacterium plantarum]
MVLGRWIGGILGLFSVLIRIVSENYPGFTEVWYARGLYPAIRGILDYSITLLPIPAFYLLLAGLLWLGWFFLKGLIKEIKGFRSRLYFCFRSLINFSGWIVFFFLFLWGYNYYRIPLYQHLSLQPAPLNTELLLQEMEATQAGLFHLRGLIQQDTDTIVNFWDFKDHRELLRREMKIILSDMGYSWRGLPTVKQFFPSGMMRRMGIFGIYFPFTGEGYLDPSLHPLEKSFTLAHELAHGFGITDEGEANFIAWLVCAESSDPFLKYAGELKLFRYQLNDLHRMDRESYSQFTENIPIAIKSDIVEIQKANLKIRPYFLELSRKSNDLYLKSQGIKAGVKSYAQLPMLAFAWRSKSGNSF